jgi:hypothetical protein
MYKINHFFFAFVAFVQVPFICVVACYPTYEDRFLYALVYKFRVCKSVHHHTFNLINQPDAATSQVYYLSFKYSSTFRASSCPSSGATTTAVAASSLPSERGDSSAVGRGRASRPARPRPTALLPPRSNGKPEAATAVVAPDDGHEDARNMLSCI